MKLFLRWICLAAATSSYIVQAGVSDSLTAYRQGNYSLVAQTVNGQLDHEPITDYYLGLMRLYGYGFLKNNALATRYFTQAGERGVLPAQWLLGRYYLIAEKNPEKALYWFKKAAAAGDIRSQMYCAAAYLFGFGVQKNPDGARQYYIAAARSGNAIAQYTLGMQFIDSRDQRNKKLGVIWLSKAAALGNVKAKLELAKMYEAGTFVAKDSDKAHEMLAAIVSKGYVPGMLVLGEQAWKQGDFNAAKIWFAKVANAKDLRGNVALARLLMTAGSPLYDPKAAFMEMLKAAQEGSSEAQQALSLMYKEGKGVGADQNLAAEWASKSKETAAHPPQLTPMAQAARWLTNDKSSGFFDSRYRLKGIFNDWNNPLALKENNYNQPPQMETVTRSEVYKPVFTMIQPSEIPISDYFDHIATTLNVVQSKSWTFPRYSLNRHIEALQRSGSLVLRHDPSVFVVDEEIMPYPSQVDVPLFDYIGQKTVGWEHKANYQVILNDLYNKAILGESSAQFELGQLYQYGIGVSQNVLQAMNYYQLAAMQQDVRAEYNLGVLYLDGKIQPADYKKGVGWLLDAAFKGNAYSQYVMANIYSEGLTDPAGVEVVAPDAKQAAAMYYLAAANHYGLAEYHLADYLVKRQKKGLSIVAQQNRAKLIRRLYQEAANQGVVEANLPLAFYNAMDDSAEKQAQAFAVAEQEANAGDSNAALLLGIMYERGLAVEANPIKALAWYLKSTANPVNAFILGTYYSQGLGLKKDLQLGKTLLQQAANKGFSYANLNLAILKHQTQEPFLSDLDKARELGNTTAGLLLADCYMAQASDPEKMRQAQAIYQYFAEKGDKEAALKLGYLYDKGLGMVIDREQAARWYLLAAEQGQPIAQYLLGHLYQLGQIAQEPNYAEAKKWYSQAQMVYSKASVALGFIYDIVDDNYQRAFEHYQIAVQKGDAIGAFNLGLIYEYGKGLPVNYEAARSLYTKAAESGFSKAMTRLGGLSLMGQGGKKDEPQALELYKKAASLGDSNALYQLGLLSETGFSVPLNFSTAVHYYQQAAEKGNDKAKLALARIYQYGLDGKKDIQLAFNIYKDLAKNNNAYAQYQLALLYFDNVLGEPNASQGKQWLQQASVNGSLQARNLLQWMDAQQQEKVSFIQSLALTKAPILAGQPADLMYFNALSEWNCGDEVSSRIILNRLMNQFPRFAPAQRVYKELNQRINIGGIMNILPSRLSSRI